MEFSEELLDAYQSVQKDYFILMNNYLELQKNYIELQEKYLNLLDQVSMHRNPEDTYREDFGGETFDKKIFDL